MIRKAGGHAELVTADLAAPDEAHKLAQQARAIVGDRLDILVANADTFKAATIEETSVEDFDELYAVNVRAPFFPVQPLLPIIHEGGSITLLSSLAARSSRETMLSRSSSTRQKPWVQMLARANTQIRQRIQRPDAEFLRCFVVAQYSMVSTNPAATSSEPSSRS